MGSVAREERLATAAFFFAFQVLKVILAFSPTQSAMAHVSTIISRTSITAPLRASPHRPTGAGSRRAAVTVRAGKGKGAQYRRGADDPYAKEKNKDKVEKQTKAAQSAEDGPLNSVFTKEEAKEEYFLFVRKMKVDGSAVPTSAASADADKKSIEDDGEYSSANIGAMLGMKGPDKDGSESKISSLGSWLPLGDVSIEAGGDLDVVVAERRRMLVKFAKVKHLKLLPVCADEKLEIGVRVQRGPPRGDDPTAVFPVATDAKHEELVWDHETMGEEGSVRAELRLMQSLPSLHKGKKSEMLSSAMDMIKRQQEQAAAIKAAQENSADEA